MISLSKGILRSEQNGDFRLSEVDLESFAEPGKESRERGAAPAESKEELTESLRCDREEQADSSDQSSGELQNELQAQVGTILEQARRQAETIVREAAQEAEQLKLQAGKDGYTEGWQRGCEEGKARAAEEAEKQHDIQKQKFYESLSRALDAIEQEKNACLKRYLEELKNVAVAVGEKVIRVSLKANGDVIRRMIEAETEKLKKKEWVRIYMEHDDYEAMIRADGEVISHLTRLSDNIKFVVMEQNTGGSCIIEMPDEIIDMSVDTQMENISKLVGSAVF